MRKTETMPFLEKKSVDLQIIQLRKVSYTKKKCFHHILNLDFKNAHDIKEDKYLSRIREQVGGEWGARWDNVVNIIQIYDMLV